jgi:hypothetical protein
MSRLSLLLTLAAACVLSAPAAASAASPTTWLCKPGLASNPCTGA